MSLDLVALAILLYMTAMGAWRGALVSSLRMLSLIGAYIASFVLATPLAEPIAGALGAPKLVGMCIAGVTVFFAVLALLRVISALVRRAQKHRDVDQPRTARDRTAGALFGAVQGAFLVLLLGVLTGWVEAGRKTGALAELPDPGGHTVTAAAQKVIETAADTMLSENNAAGRAAARLAARPDRAIEDAHKLMENPVVRSLQRDPLFWSYVETGAIDRALNTETFLAFSGDPELRQGLAGFGLVSDEDARDPESFRRQMKPVLEEIGPRVRALRNDPALRELANDPATSEALRQGNTLALLGDPRFRSLLQRVLEADSSAPAAPAPPD
jgi:uncharacterized membrane protein required for colicin V production